MRRKPRLNSPSHPHTGAHDSDLLKETHNAIGQYITRAQLYRKLGQAQRAATYYGFLGKYYFVRGDRDKSWHYFEEKQKLLECTR